MIRRHEERLRGSLAKCGLAAQPGAGADAVGALVEAKQEVRYWWTVHVPAKERADKRREAERDLADALYWSGQVFSVWVRELE